MDTVEILAGMAGLEGIQALLKGRPSRRRLRKETQVLLREDYRPGPFHLTRAKYKPGRKLQAYFTFPVFASEGGSKPPVHLAAAWDNGPNGAVYTDKMRQMQEEAEKRGVRPGFRELWRHIPEQVMDLQVWPLDPEFPQLVRLGDPAYMAAAFTSLGLAGKQKKLPVVTPIRYRPGERHVLRYELDLPEMPLGDPNPRLYAKLYTSAEEASQTFKIANQVVSWLAANNYGLYGNQPAAMSQDDSVIFYPHAPGVPLSSLLHHSPVWLGPRLRTIGRSLAMLHHCPAAAFFGLRKNSFPDEVVVVKRACDPIQALQPDTYQKIIEILDKLLEQYAALPQEEPTFTHSDFKADHLLVSPQGMTLIDFDTCTLTDPALDLGKFEADLEWWFAMRGIPGVEVAQAEVVRGYQEEMTPGAAVEARLARARLFHILILVKIVARRASLFNKNWAATTARLVDRAGAKI